MSSTSPHSMVNVGPLTSEIGSGVWGTPANFNRFCILASLLHQRRSMEANQTLHDVWPSPGLLHYVYIWGVGALAANGILPSAKFTLCPSLAFSYFGSITARHSSSGHPPNFAAWYLHATGRLSHFDIGRSNCLVFAVFLSYARAELLFISLQGLSVECNSVVEYHIQLKLTPILCDFSLFWPKFGSYGNIHYTFAIRNILFGFANHKNWLL